MYDPLTNEKNKSNTVFSALISVSQNARHPTSIINKFHITNPKEAKIINISKLPTLAGAKYEGKKILPTISINNGTVTLEINIVEVLITVIKGKFTGLVRY